MSLKAKAAALNGERADEARHEARKNAIEMRDRIRVELDRQLQKAIERGDLETVPSVAFLDSSTYQYPKRKSSNHSLDPRGIYWTSEQIFRFRVDDVIVRGWGDYRDVRVEPAIVCAGCGAEFNVALAEMLMNPGYRPPEFVEHIGWAQSCGWRCAVCTTGVPEECPTCGRSNRR